MNFIVSCSFVEFKGNFCEINSGRCSDDEQFSRNPKNPAFNGLTKLKH